jgi:hypothetical protein
VAYIQRDDQARDDGDRGDGQPGGARPRRRTRNRERRARTVRFALTDTEYAELSDAARHAGLLPVTEDCDEGGAEDSDVGVL